jgi:RNA-directed DNA polymerase
MLALILTPIISPSLSDKCYHLEGRGGIKQTIRTIKKNRKQYKHAIKSDIANFYSSINHTVLIDLLKEWTTDPTLLDLIEDSMARVIYHDGLYSDINLGIPYGSPLSPLLGAIALSPLDLAMEGKKGIFYVRFMDDWLILTKTKGQLRRAIKRMHKVVSTLKQILHPLKTWIGTLKKSFSFLCHEIKPEGLGLASETIQKSVNKLQKLYEQQASKKCLSQYIQRFTSWIKSGLNDDELNKSIIDYQKAIQNMYKQITLMRFLRFYVCFRYLFALSL